MDKRSADERAARAATAALPIAVDMDGTLLLTDSLHENVFHLLRTAPAEALKIPLWLMSGKARLKSRLAAIPGLRAGLWPVRGDLVAWLDARAAAGHEIILATAADRQIGEAVAARFPFISRIVASDGERNLKGSAKAEALQAMFPDGFIYVGDSVSDRSVWAAASGGSAIAGRVNALRRHANPEVGVIAEFPSAGSQLRIWRQGARVHQWAKNLLVFVPLVLSGQMDSPAGWMRTLAVFVALGLVASGTYLLNDLWDLDSDRAHREKRFRPLPSGQMSIAAGSTGAAIGIVGGCVLAGWLGAPVLGAVLLYLVVTLAYSFGLKRIPILDVTILALLFTVRLLIGAAAVSVPLSIWLLMFSLFLFGSLSLAKRCAELGPLKAPDKNAKVAGRGYRADDLEFLTALGVATSTSSILVFVLYMMESAFPAGVYSHPSLLWAAPVFLFLFINRIWLLCHRREMNEDPVLFAVRDPVSLALGAAITVTVAAAMGLFDI